jgi:hypothetical protein
MQSKDKKSLFEQLRASLIMLAFGLATLAFLVAIDRPEWFELRPVSGTAAAMSNAGTQAAAEQS